MTAQLQLGLDRDPRHVALDRAIVRVLRLPELHEQTREILRILAARKGRQQAITAAAIARLLGLAPGEGSRRVITEAVEHLRRLRIPVGASKRPPWGYFLIVDADDLRAIEHLKLEAIQLYVRYAQLAGGQYARELLGQMAQALEAEDAPQSRTGSQPVRPVQRGAA